jgi:hypothetical protein
MDRRYTLKHARVAMEPLRNSMEMRDRFWTALFLLWSMNRQFAQQSLPVGLTLANPTGAATYPVVP